MTSPTGEVNNDNGSEPKTEPCGTLVSDLQVVDVSLQTLAKHERPSR